MTQAKCSDDALKRVRDYAVEEPSFTATFAAWDMTRTGAPITHHTVRAAIDWLVAKGVIRLIEDAGRAGKVYAYVPPKAEANVRRLPLAELDAERELRRAVGGEPVPHTRIEGPSGKPGRDRRRQEQGVRLGRGKGK